MALLNYLIPVLFIVFSFSQLIRIQFQNAAAVNLIDICIASLIVVWLIFQKKKENYYLKTPILLFISISFISLLFSLASYTQNQVEVGALYLVRWTLYALLYFVFKDVGELISNKTVKWIYIGGLITIILGFLQLIFYPSLRNLYYLGWDEHLNRIFSTFLDPNFAGIFFVLFFIFIFIIRDNFKSNKIFTLLSNIILVLSFISIILTYSRGALLMLGVSTLTYCVLLKKYKLLGVFIGIMIVIFIALSPGFYLENTNLLRMASVGQRIETSKDALNIYSKNPVFGVGFNNLRYAREKYGFHDTSKVGPSHSAAGADNSFVFVLVTTGIPGLIIYILLLYKTFKLGFNNLKKNKFALILVVSLAGLAVNSLTINSLFYGFVMIWVWILAGLTDSEKIPD
ncbi:MAG: O-antigen ligase family protein [Patescibacteria group bacterium]